MTQTDINKDINQVRKYFSTYNKPNVIYYIEHYKVTNSGLIMVRYSMVQEEEYFSIDELSYNFKNKKGQVHFSSELLKTKTRAIAQEALEQLVIANDQKGFEYLDDFSSRLFDIHSKTWAMPTPTLEKSMSFYGNNSGSTERLLTQTVKKGLFVNVCIDSQGKITITDAKNDMSESTDNLITERVEQALRGLIALKGFRAAVMCGFYDGNELLIIDAQYLGTKSLYSLTLKERDLFISRYFRLADLKGVVTYADCKEEAPNKWLTVYSFGTSKAKIIRSEASVYPEGNFPIVTDGKEQKVAIAESTNHLGLGYNPDKPRMSFPIQYPSKSKTLIDNDYWIIGRLNDNQDQILI